MKGLLQRLVLGVALAVLMGGVPGLAAPQQPAPQAEAQSYKEGVHPLKSEQGAYLMEHLLVDYFNGSFLTSADGKILFPIQVLKDGQLLLEGCFMTDVKGAESALLVLEPGEGGLPRFRRLPGNPRLNEVKAILDKVYWQVRQEEAKQLNNSK